jgi:hypothetical protein
LTDNVLVYNSPIGQSKLPSGHFELVEELPDCEDCFSKCQVRTLISRKARARTLLAARETPEAQPEHQLLPLSLNCQPQAVFFGAALPDFDIALAFGAAAGIVRLCGIALRNRDSSLVAGTDPEELRRLRESWLKRKLTESGAELDKAVHAVMEKMKADHAKGRVTVYYLLAEHFKKLDGLVKSATAP